MADVNPILAFCERIINGRGGLHDFEYYEMAIPSYDRDVSVAIWIIKCLANPKVKGSQYILELIAERRQYLQEQTDHVHQRL